MSEENRDGRRMLNGILTVLVSFIFVLFVMRLAGVLPELDFSFLKFSSDNNEKIENVNTEENIFVTIPEETAEPDSDNYTTVKTTGVDPNAITVVMYLHDWINSKASISFKNNTNKTITQFTGRIFYYDMKDNMLDYQDINQDVTIDPGMAKTCTINGYGHDDHYAYYKSEVRNQERKYKINFQVKSYKTK